MSKSIKIELTKEMIMAIQVAIDELGNSGDWCDFYTNKKVDKIFQGITEIRNSEIYTNQTKK
jgi:hypothetical protein